MARTTTRPAPVEEQTGSKPGERELNKVLLYTPPWIAGVLLYGLGWFFFATLSSDDPQVVAWTTAGITACVLGLTVYTWTQSHARSLQGRLHTTLTTFAAGMWVCAATINSPVSPFTGRAIIIGGVALAISFNIRSVIRVKGVDVQAVASDPLKALFGDGAKRAGMPELEATTTARGDHKVEADVQLPPGQMTAEDLQRKIAYIESGMELPPGSVTTSIDPDNSSKAKVVISDPRVMNAAIPWPGPSRPGASVAEPFRLALWQDLDELAYVIPGHHLQMMGMTGAGKGFGGAWNYLAEFMSRKDGAVFAGDITKGEQTLGPLRPALHRFETTKAGVRAMLSELQKEVKPRTDYLASKGLAKWKPGCGLTYWLIWLEEFPDIFDCMTSDEQEKFLSMLKAIRSAGGTIVMSLQRSDYTQMPTLARGQLAKMCFGVENSGDASFGLSERQEDAGARPELWTNAKPGMAYLDAPGIDDGRIAMPMRTFAWGIDEHGVFDDELANASMREYAAQWPAAARDVDETTARLSRLVQPEAPASAVAPAASAVDPELLALAAAMVVESQFGSPQMIHRKARVPFEQAKALESALADIGVLGPPREGAARQVLVGPDELPELLARLKGDDPEEEVVDEDEEDLGDVAGEYVETDDPDPELVADADGEIPDIPEGDPPWRFESGPKMTDAEKRAALLTLLRDWWDADRREFQTGDLAALWTTTDATRSWAQKRLRKLRDEGVLGYDEEAQRHLMLARPE
uniref:hypothetical protein n=1 Tax=Herbidospora sakaeratensis TaxID=564415 RepID=UPI0007823DCE|nr:hypothetical protein [Herbidospora sakaeratensis]